MKILVADDDIVARKVLKAFLQQSNYEPVIAEDGEAALAMLLAPDGPKIAIVDWMMPRLNGTDLCVRLRKSDLLIQPYVIILSAKNEKGVITQALDVGADALKKKPFNIQDMHAQLRAGERAIAHQLELCRRSGLPDPAAAADSGGAPNDSAATGANPPAPTPAELDAIVTEALRELGLTQPVRRERLGSDKRFPRAWAGFLFRDEQRWLDLVFETDEASLAHLRELTSAGKAAHADLRSTFHHEFPRAVWNGVRHALTAAGHHSVSPLRPLTVVRERRPVIENEESHHFSLGGRTSFTVVLVSQSSPLLHKPVLQLCEHDMLAEAYPPADTGVPLLQAGAVLTDRLIKRLAEFGENDDDLPPVSVHQPSPLAHHFNPTSHAPAPRAEAGHHAHGHDHEPRADFALDPVR